MIWTGCDLQREKCSFFASATRASPCVGGRHEGASFECVPICPSSPLTGPARSADARRLHLAKPLPGSAYQTGVRLIKLRTTPSGGRDGAGMMAATWCRRAVRSCFPARRCRNQPEPGPGNLEPLRRLPAWRAGCFIKTSCACDHTVLMDRGFLTA